MLDVIFKDLKSILKNDAEKVSQQKTKQNTAQKKKSAPKKAPAANNLDIYSVAATLYGEARDLDEKGITRVAETIRNRHTFYSQNKARGIKKITYRDIVSAPNQYIGFDEYKNKSLKDFKQFEKNLSPTEKKKWDRCMNIARQVVNSQLKTNYAKGALGFNQASVAANKRNFKTQLVFKDDACYKDNPKKSSPHVFFGDFHLLSLKDKNGKILAKGGNPKDDKSRLLAQNKKKQSGGRV